ncbi:putative phosphatidylserine decarboxylase protein [Hirsutella rhossiliensis]|uniref:Phosphatidylserine decarboxylase protein n=1 Tax=Hirsutella rhossiliensis TaxID=111463 RepID=A0A9P8N4F0_9HYPO|nr:putative phosphatidylserine decarboxylase protein [Hirsutella rhossiliensis]KAH0965624.1 putative phosphatidylserine decarboxylase protein [Hirsutella rhossiliensis]
MSGLPTAPDREIGFQPPPSRPRAPVPIIDVDQVIYNPIIIVLVGYLEEIPQFMDKLKIKDARSFLVFSNDLLKWIPHENFEGKDIYDILCMFYFIFHQPPLLGLQTAIYPDQVGQPLTWLSSWIVVYAQLIGLFMDTPASLTEESLETFKNSPKYNFDEALVPSGGFRTFNEFFARHLKHGARPIDSPNDDRVIVYPADCTYDNSVDVTVSTECVDN